ncbi:nitrogen fixation protein NifZ [Candidatus Accumulibacter sp. ACC003]|uniref:nitrogen fixation protein NifZ n=1 Tax=Candidatus Accumulibacter sp. ACC003 TaxID=2823334 RepID=UPI0025B90C33|nr:nitrogen fixation protein NifZ [Candidatus Accumulibacter sp. ACC003]
MRGARWDYGEPVRLTRNVRNDGTYPGLDSGAPLVRRGSIGYVVDIGTFLQDQIIYAVNFLDQARTVGCREEELIGADEAWAPSRFEFRDRVCAAKSLAIGGVVLVAAGAVGEVVKVIRDAPGGAAYQVHFDALAGRVLQIPEDALRPDELSRAAKDNDDATPLP